MYQALGRSQGGLSTKIHASTDALGNPTAFHLTPGQASDLDGADVLLPQIVSDTVLADKAFDADERVLLPLEQAGKTTVIPPKANRKAQREYDENLYQERHLIENSSPNSSNTALSPPATTKRCVISSLLSTSPLL